MIAHDRRYAENTASDCLQLYGNTFQRSGDHWRSKAILRFCDSSDPAIMSDHTETRLKDDGGKVARWLHSHVKSLYSVFKSVDL